MTSSVTVTVNQTPHLLGVRTASLGSHATKQFSATTKDQFGAAMTAQPTFTWSNTGAGSVSSLGLYTASYASGAANVAAAAGGLNGSASVTITNTAPTVATAASSTPGAGIAMAVNLAVLGADADGGGESNLTYAWAATALPSGAAAPTFSANATNAAKQTTASFTTAGAYTLTVTITDAGGLSVTSSVNVTMAKTLPKLANAAIGANASNPAIAGPTADPDHDGIPNLLEYAFNTDPLVPDIGVLPVPDIEGTNAILSYRKRCSLDHSLHDRATTDLVT